MYNTNLEHLIDEFNNKQSPSDRLSVIEKIFKEEAKTLTEIIESVTATKRLYTRVLEYYGAFCISEKVKNAFINRVKSDRLKRFTNFSAYFKKAILLEMKALYSTKDFETHYSRSLLFFDIFHEDLERQLGNFPIEKNPEDCMKNLYNSFQDMYKSLEGNRLMEAWRLTRAYKERLKTCKGTPEEKQLLESLLERFIGHYYQRLGKMRIAQKHLIKSIKILEASSNEFKQFLFANKILLADNTAQTDPEKAVEILKEITQAKYTDEGESEDIMQSALADANMRAAQFAALFNFDESKRFLDKVPYADYPIKTELVLQIANATVYVNSNKPEKALQEITLIEDLISGSAGGEPNEYRKLQFHMIKSIATLENFKTRSPKQLADARKNLLEAKNCNVMLGSRYWNAIIQIFDGYIEEKNNLIREGIKELNKSGASFFAEWYKSLLAKS